MKLDLDRYTYIGCIPVKAHPTHPTDQSPCIIKACPGCKERMWVSEKKRAMKKRNPTKVKIYCFLCLVKASNEQGYEPEIFDINKMN